MGVVYNSSITTDGLVLCLDAANRRSYPGSGLIWNDLSGNGNSGELKNGPTFSSLNGGNIIHDGLNDYVLANNISLNSKFSSTSVSHFIWVYPTAAGQIVAEIGQTTPNSNWHDSNIEINASGAFSFSTWHGSLTNKVTSSNQSFNKWYYVGFTYNGTILTAYINGTQIGTTNFTRQAPYNNGYQTHYALFAQDATNMGTNAYGKGNIAMFCVYNKALNLLEVQQNYNATKGRFI